MGYWVSSIYAISPNDTHTFFVYFIPYSDWMEGEEGGWVNRWMNEHFHRIAAEVGQHKGVFIAPPPGREREYRDSLGGAQAYLAQSLGIEDRYGGFFEQLFSKFGGSRRRSGDPYEEDDADFLHSGAPYLIISREPILPDSSASTGELAVIRLAACRDESHLKEVVKIVASAIRSDDLTLLGQINDRPKMKWRRKIFESLNTVIILKPEVSGVGVDLNEAIRLVDDSIQRKAEYREMVRRAPSHRQNQE
jgi:hypothetical protein